jgi:tetratricopeptide (TPR) repeat protein
VLHFNVECRLNYLELAEKINTEIGRVDGQIRSLSNIGSVYLTLGELRVALGYHERALMKAEQTGNLAIIPTILSNIGLSYCSLNEPQKVLKNLDKALKLAGEVDDLEAQTHILGNIGLAYRKQSNSNKALELFEQTLKIAKKIGNLHFQAAALGNIGIIYSSFFGEHLKALEYFHCALKIQEQTGYLEGKANELHNIGFIYTRLEEYRKALDFLMQALEIYTMLGAKDKIAMCEQNIAASKHLLSRLGSE